MPPVSVVNTLNLQSNGLDRFDRIVDQRWLDASSAVAAERLRYGYDRDGNRTYSENLVDAGPAAAARRHRTAAAAGAASAGPAGTSARISAAGRTVFFRLASHPGSGSSGVCGAGAVRSCWSMSMYFRSITGQA